MPNHPSSQVPNQNLGPAINQGQVPVQNQVPQTPNPQTPASSQVQTQVQNQNESQQMVYQNPEGVQEIPTQMPHQIESTGAQRTQTEFAASVLDDSGKQLIQSPVTNPVTIELPVNQQALTEWSAGLVADSKTWLSRFWLRLSKKAKHYGWGTIVRGGGQ